MKQKAGISDKNQLKKTFTNPLNTFLCLTFYINVQPLISLCEKQLQIWLLFGFNSFRAQQKCALMCTGFNQNINNLCIELVKVMYVFGCVCVKRVGLGLCLGIC